MVLATFHENRCNMWFALRTVLVLWKFKCYRGAMMRTVQGLLVNSHSVRYYLPHFLFIITLTNLDLSFWRNTITTMFFEISKHLQPTSVISRPALVLSRLWSGQSSISNTVHCQISRKPFSMLSPCDNWFCMDESFVILGAGLVPQAHCSCSTLHCQNCYPSRSGYLGTYSNVPQSKNKDGMSTISIKNTVASTPHPPLLPITSQLAQDIEDSKKRSLRCIDD